MRKGASKAMGGTYEASTGVTVSTEANNNVSKFIVGDKGHAEKRTRLIQRHCKARLQYRRLRVSFLRPKH